MKARDFNKLEKHFTQANTLRSRIRSLEQMIHGIKSRLDEGSKELQVHVQAKPARHGRMRYDSGVTMTLPELMLRDAILPALKDQLERLRKEFKEMPAIQG